jgi:type I site-specific restriction endonuclease
MPIHLISANHTTAQSSPSGEPETNVQRNYADTLAALIRKVGAQWVAEEYSEEAEEESGRLSLTPKIADENGAKHRFCDPRKEERMQIGYVGQQELHLYIGMHDDDWNISNDEARRKSWALDIGKYFEVRERFWLDKIADLKDKTVVFGCGDAHIDTFSKQLKAKSWDVHVAARSVGGITDEDQRNIAEGLQYLKEHPEILDEDWFSRVYPNASSGSD